MTEENKDPVANALGIPPLKEESPASVEEKKSELIPVESDKKNIALVQDQVAVEDYDYSRNTIKDTISTGKQALEMMLSIAQQREDPKDFEAIVKLIDSINGANDNLLKNQQRIREIIDVDELKNPSNGRTTIKKIDANNILFVGPTSDLSKEMGQDARTLLEKVDISKDKNAK